MKFNPYSGASAASVLLTVLVIAAELSPQFKAVLAAAFTHHWIAKAVLMTAAFLIAGIAIKKSGKMIAWYSVLGSIVLIFLFYELHSVTA